MTVKQLIEKLQEFPEDMPVVTWFTIDAEDIVNPDSIEIAVVRHDPEHVFGLDFDYVNLT